MGLDGPIPRCQFPQLEWGTEGPCGERFSELRACRQTGLGLDLKGPEHERRSRGAAPGPSRCAPSCQKSCLPANVLLGRDVTPRSRAQRGPECRGPSTRLRCPGLGACLRLPALHTESKTQADPCRPRTSAQPGAQAWQLLPCPPCRGQSGKGRKAEPCAPRARLCHMALPRGIAPGSCGEWKCGLWRQATQVCEGRARQCPQQLCSL